MTTVQPHVKLFIPQSVFGCFTVMASHLCDFHSGSLGVMEGGFLAQKAPGGIWRCRCTGRAGLPGGGSCVDMEGLRGVGGYLDWGSLPSPHRAQPGR